MISLVITEPAENDLLDLWFYVATDSYPTYADTLLDKLYAHFKLLALNSDMGVERDEIGEGIRLFLVENINIIYRLKDEVLLILRVHHSAQDSNALKL